MELPSITLSALSSGSKGAPLHHTLIAAALASVPGRLVKYGAIRSTGTRSGRSLPTSVDIRCVAARTSPWGAKFGMQAVQEKAGFLFCRLMFPDLEGRRRKRG